MLSNLCLIKPLNIKRVVLFATIIPIYIEITKCYGFLSEEYVIKHKAKRYHTAGEMIVKSKFYSAHAGCILCDVIRKRTLLSVMTLSSIHKKTQEPKDNIPWVQKQ